jgi:hypothetical protein
MGNFDDTIEKLRNQIGENVAVLKASAEWAQVEKLYRALVTIEELAEVPITSLAEIFNFQDAKSTISVKAGEFIQMDALDAAKLEKKKDEASTLDEIIEAIEKGGAKSVSRNDLRSSLGRSNWDVVKAPNQELYTLVKYAPHVTRGGKRKKAAGDAVPTTPQNESAVARPEPAISPEVPTEGK